VRGGANALFLTVSAEQQKQQLAQMQVHAPNTGAQTTNSRLIVLQSISLTQMAFMEQSSNSQLSVLQNM
jgi:hypothetical protein